MIEDNVRCFTKSRNEIRRIQGNDQNGLVYCSNLMLYFPQLYLIQGKMDREDLIERGLNPDVLGSDSSVSWSRYDLNARDMARIGSYAATAVDHLDQRFTSHSVVIRHHRTRSSAIQCLAQYDEATMGLDDYEDVIETGIFRTNSGLFTMLVRPTPSCWPGPLLFHVAQITMNDGETTVQWGRVTGPDGKRLDSRRFQLCGDDGEKEKTAMIVNFSKREPKQNEHNNR